VLLPSLVPFTDVYYRFADGLRAEQKGSVISAHWLRQDGPPDVERFRPARAPTVAVLSHRAPAP